MRNLCLSGSDTIQLFLKSRRRSKSKRKHLTQSLFLKNKICQQLNKRLNKVRKHDDSLHIHTCGCSVSFISRKNAE